MADMRIQTSFAFDPAIGYPGQLANTNNDIITMKNAEASAEIAFGRAVVWDTSSPASDKSALLPAAETDKVVGIVIRSHAYEVGSADGLGTTGLKPGALMNILVRGVILVTAEDAVKPGDPLWVRAVAGGDPEFPGGLTNADDSTDTIDCSTKGTWLTSADAGGLAWLRVNF